MQVPVGIAHRRANDRFDVVLYNETSVIWPGN